MDPNGSFTSDEDYICYVSPLHEALRGTTAMPTLEEFQFNNSMPFSDPFMHSSSMDVSLPPPILPSSSILVAPADDSPSPFLGNFTALSMIQGDPLAQSDDYISNVSPLHEAFRGTTSMPTLEQLQQLQQLNNSLPISTSFMNSVPFAPESNEQAMFQAGGHSTLPYNMGGTSSFVGNFTATSEIQGNTLASVDASLNSYGAFNPSMDSTSSFVGNFMQAPSTIQGNPLPTMDANLNSYAAFNPSPVSNYPEWPTYGEQKPNTILRPQHNGGNYGMVPPFNPAHISPFPGSSQAQLGTQRMMMGAPNATFHRNFAPSSSSAVPEGPKLPEYTCRRCEVTFYNSQAYGGHMSSHSKAKNKGLLD